MNFTLIGTGFIMPRHASSIHRVGGKIIDVVNTAYGKDTWKNVIKNTSAEYIVILGPNDLHLDMLRLAVDSGKKVLCEKPLGISSQGIEPFLGRKDVFTVLQLRYHPLVQKMKEVRDSSDHLTVDMDISVYRDPHYYSSWKGQRERSGGVLFNLGIHYFDLLLNVFGKPHTVRTKFLDDKTGEGNFIGEKYKCNWRVSTDEKRESQRRIFKVNGIDFNFSSQDNLSYEDLHVLVYKDMLNGEGVFPDEAIKSVQFVEKLYI